MCQVSVFLCFLIKFFLAQLSFFKSQFQMCLKISIPNKKNFQFSINQFPSEVLTKFFKRLFFMGEILLVVNSQSVLQVLSQTWRESDKKKLCFFSGKNFFRNKSTTRFINSRFGFGFRCFTEKETQSIQFKQLVSTSFSSSFSIILISREMIS